MLDHLDFDAALGASRLPPPGSNRGYRPEQLIVQFMLSVWCGANRFEHGEVTRHDPVLRRLFGFERMANFKAVMRLFRKFTRVDNERVLGELFGAVAHKRPLPGLIHHTAGVSIARTSISACCGSSQCADGKLRGYAKNELVHHQRYETRAQAMREITEYIEIFYNRQRRHSKFGNLAPAVFAQPCQHPVAA